MQDAAQGAQQADEPPIYDPILDTIDPAWAECFLAAVGNTNERLTSPSADQLAELAERCTQEALKRLNSYLVSGERRSSYDGVDRLEAAERLLNCAAALRSHMKKGK